MFLKVGDRMLDIGKQQICHLPREIPPHQNPLEGLAGKITGEGIGRHLPAPHPEPISQIVQGEARRGVLGQRPDNRRNSLVGPAVVNDLEAF